MASAGGASSLSDVLLCPVCCEQINNPKMIPCGHSFCLKPCLKDLLKVSPKCPLCRQDIQPTSSGHADDFPTNYALQSLLSSGLVEGVHSLKATAPEANEEQSKCIMRDNQTVQFCGTCSVLLCEECYSIHDQDHETEEVSKVAERKLDELQPIIDEIAQVRIAITANTEALKEAMVRCETSSKLAKAKIDEAAASVIDLVRKRQVELHHDVVRGKEEMMKKIKKVEVQNIDLELLANHAESMGGSSMDSFRRHDIRDNGTMDILMTKGEQMKEELVNIKIPSGKIAVSFPPELSCAFSGKVYFENEVPGRPSSSAVRLRSFFELTKYHGYVCFSSKLILWLHFSNGVLTFVPVNKKILSESVDFPVNTTGIKAISPTLDKKRRSLLMNDSVVVLRVTYDLLNGISIDQRSIPNEVLFSIKAVSWDETREGCYALLHDKVSICHLVFGKSSKAKSTVRLDSSANCGSSLQFHVSESGGMAICDQANKIVKYFGKVQPQVTRTVSRSGIAGAIPTCVTSLGSNQKWFVLWEKDKIGEIIQYSDFFQCERTVLTEFNISSFHFMDEEYLITSSQDHSGLIVYRTDGD